MKRTLIVIERKGVAWERQFTQKGGTTKVPIKKDIAKGLHIQRGQKAHFELGKDLDTGEDVIVVYPEKRNKPSG